MCQKRDPSIPVDWFIGSKSSERLGKSPLATSDGREQRFLVMEFNAPITSA
jgi:hypothetical protein